MSNSISEITRLVRYGVDSFATIHRKLYELIESGLTFEEAVTELEKYYLEKSKS